MSQSVDIFFVLRYHTVKAFAFTKAATFTGMDRFEISTLSVYYGALLTERQNELIRLHYDEAISLGELADMYSVSRQAVLDGIKRGECALKEFEDKLGLAGRDGRAAKTLSDAEDALSRGDTVGCARLIGAAKALLEE